METVAPLGSTYQAGTLSGNPLAMAAGIATLRVLAEPGVYERLEALAAQVGQGLVEAAARRPAAPTTLNRVGAMMTLFFCEGPVTSFADARRADTALYAALLAPHARAAASTWRPRSSSRPWCRWRSPTPTSPGAAAAAAAFFAG